LDNLEGKDFVIELRSAEGHYERLPDLAAELVRMNVDVIVTASSPAIRPAQQATTTIPIVMGYSTDPVHNGFVAGFAHPGSNTTGLAASVVVLLAGSTSTATRVAAGTISRRSCNRFVTSSIWRIFVPVRLPPGRARLATRPSLTGSSAETKTIGIVVVAAFAANTAG
jgi:hypothetical protein